MYRTTFSAMSGLQILQLYLSPCFYWVAFKSALNWKEKEKSKNEIWWDGESWGQFLSDVSKSLHSGASTGVIVGGKCMRSINKKSYIIIKYGYKSFCQWNGLWKAKLYKMFLTVLLNYSFTLHSWTCQLNVSLNHFGITKKQLTDSEKM